MHLLVQDGEEAVLVIEITVLPPMNWLQNCIFADLDDCFIIFMELGRYIFNND